MSSFKEKVVDILLLYKFRVWTLLIYTGILSYLIAVQYGYIFDTTKIYPLFVAGTLSIMGNGAINEYLEIEYDKIMKRTKNRPLVKGTIPPRFAISSGIILIIISVIISYILINPLTTSFILLATIIYFVYTKYLKRTTWINVLIGGFAGSCTAWCGWSA
ncbi:MAG: UbiA family prenyltransferase, partial [Thermoproteota archaeon]